MFQFHLELSQRKQKIAKVISIQKSEEADLVNNYRPIYLLKFTIRDASNIIFQFLFCCAFQKSLRGLSISVHLTFYREIMFYLICSLDFEINIL